MENTLPTTYNDIDLLPVFRTGLQTRYLVIYKGRGLAYRPRTAGRRGLGLTHPGCAMFVVHAGSKALAKVVAKVEKGQLVPTALPENANLADIVSHDTPLMPPDQIAAFLAVDAAARARKAREAGLREDLGALSPEHMDAAVAYIASLKAKANQG